MMVPVLHELYGVCCTTNCARHPQSEAMQTCPMSLALTEVTRPELVCRWEPGCCTTQPRAGAAWCACPSPSSLARCQQVRCWAVAGGIG